MSESAQERNHLSLPDEEWRSVVGYEYVYEVSSHGRVRRIKRGRGAVCGRILKQFLSGPPKKRYLCVWLSDRETGRTTRPKVHALVARAFIGPAPVGHIVNHLDTHKTNNHWRNLEYTTHLGNSLHAIANGCKPGLLTAATVREMRRMLQAASPTAVARIMNIPFDVVYRVHSKRTYRWVN